jgi:hypothetical protein
MLNTICLPANSSQFAAWAWSCHVSDKYQLRRLLLQQDMAIYAVVDLITISGTHSIQRALHVAL